MNGIFLRWGRHKFAYRKFKPLREMQPARDGLACAAMLLNYFGKKVCYEALFAECVARQQNGNSRDLISIFGEYGLRPRPLGCTVDDVPRLKLPCLILWNKHHFVVLTDIIAGQYYIYDPAACSHVIKLDPVVFECHFAEMAVELYQPDEPKQELADLIKTAPPENFTALTHISVVIPTFNRPVELARALQSVFNQGYSKLQVIVINDGSQSQYDVVLAEYGAKITYIQHPTTLGVSAARNTGIKAAAGEWVLFLDDDDELANNYINALSRTIRANANIAFFWSNVKEARYVKNQFTGYHLLRYSAKAKGTRLMCDATTIGAGYGFAVKRHALLDVGMFNPNYTLGEDTDLIYKLLSKGHRPQLVDVIGVINHQHTQDRLTLNFDVYSATNTYEKIAANYAFFLQQHTQINLILMFWMAKVHFSAGNFEAGDKAAKRLLAFWWKHPVDTWIRYRQLTRLRRESSAAVAVGDEPLISVVIPTFNRPAELTRALQSVFSQGLNNLQVIVINDGSQSQYHKVLAEYADRITYLEHPASLGVSGARNTGIHAATGEWVLFLDDDDELADNYINALGRAIRDNANVAFFWSNVMEYHYVNNQLLGYRLRRYSAKAKGTRLIAAAGSIGASYGLAVRRHVLLDVGLFNTNYAVGEDTDLIYKLLSQGHQPQPLDVIGVIKHQHNQDRLTLNLDVYSASNICEKIAANYANFLQRHPRLYLDLLAWAAKVHYSAQNFDAGDKAATRLLALWWKLPLVTWLAYKQLVRQRSEACAAKAEISDKA